MWGRNGELIRSRSRDGAGPDEVEARLYSNATSKCIGDSRGLCRCGGAANGNAVRDLEEAGARSLCARLSIGEEGLLAS